MGRSSTYKLLFAVHDHCEFAEVTVADSPRDANACENSPILVTNDDMWAIPHARNGMSAGIRAFGIDGNTLHVNALRVTAADSTPDNVAVAAFIAVGLYADRIDDADCYIDNFIHGGRIRFPETDDELADWLRLSP